MQRTKKAVELRRDKRKRAKLKEAMAKYNQEHRKLVDVFKEYKNTDKVEKALLSQFRKTNIAARAVNELL